MNPNLARPYSRRSTLRLGLGLALAAAAPAAASACSSQDHLVTGLTEEAVRQALAAGASRVVLPAGQIILGQTLRIPPGVSLVGAGAERTRFTASAAIGPGQAMIEGSGDGIVLTGFSLDGRVGSGSSTGHGVQLSGSGHRLSGLSVRDVVQAGYRLAISDSEVADCVATDCGRTGYTDNHGFMLFTTAREGLGALRRTTFRRCRVDHAFRKAFAVYSDGPEISEVLFEDCVARGSGLAEESGGGFYVVPVTPVRVAQVAVRGCLAEGNYVNYEIGPVAGLTVTGCQSRNARATGFLFHGSRDLDIVNNTDDGSGVDSMRFDNVLGASVGGRVTNNVLTDANRQTRGFASYINLEGAERIVVTDNVFGDQDGRAPYGIYEGARAGKNDIRANRRIERR